MIPKRPSLFHTLAFRTDITQPRVNLEQHRALLNHAVKMRREVSPKLLCTGAGRYTVTVSGSSLSWNKSALPPPASPVLSAVTSRRPLLFWTTHRNSERHEGFFLQTCVLESLFYLGIWKHSCPCRAREFLSLHFGHDKVVCSAVSPRRAAANWVGSTGELAELARTIMLQNCFV